MNRLVPTLNAAKKKPRALMYKRDERQGRTVRVQLKKFDDAVKVRKWNYKLQKWGRWERYA